MDKHNAKKEKKRREFWRKLNFKYRISAMNESTLEEMWKVRTSIFGGGCMLVFFAIFLISLTSIIIVATPIKNYLPGFMDAEIREKALTSAMEIETLEKQLIQQDQYLENLRAVFAGERDLDSLKMMDTIHVSEADPKLKKTSREAEFSQRYQEEDMYNLSVLVSENDMQISGVVFYKPAKGILLEAFDATKNHSYVKLQLANKETILAVQDGIVIYSGYLAENGYTIQVQHKNGFVSVYKHLTHLMKKTGDQVTTGEALAVANHMTKDEKGKSVIDTDNNFIIFELWHNAKAVDPSKYLSF